MAEDRREVLEGLYRPAGPLEGTTCQQEHGLAVVDDPHRSTFGLGTGPRRAPPVAPAIRIVHGGMLRTAVDERRGEIHTHAPRSASWTLLVAVGPDAGPVPHNVSCHGPSHLTGLWVAQQQSAVV